MLQYFATFNFVLYYRVVALMHQQTRETLSLFTDNLTTSLNGSLHQFERAFMKLDIFALASDRKINFQKSLAIYLGSNIGKLQKLFENKGLNWSSTEIKYLSVNLPVNNLKSEK